MTFALIFELDGLLCINFITKIITKLKYPVLTSIDRLGCCLKNKAMKN